jgi:hypothetical protein
MLNNFRYVVGFAEFGSYALLCTHMRPIMMCVTGFLRSQERCDVSHVSHTGTGRKSEVVDCDAAIHCLRVSLKTRLKPIKFQIWC